MRNSKIRGDRSFDDRGSKYKGRGDGGDFGGSRGGFRSSSRDSFRPMHKAICAECSKPCEVPFKPSGNKPVLCSNCFAEQNESRPQRDTYSHNSARSFSPSHRPEGKSDNYMGAQKLELIVQKLDKIIEILLDNKNKPISFNDLSDKKVTKVKDIPETKKESNDKPVKAKKVVKRSVKKSSKKK